MKALYSLLTILSLALIAISCNDNNLDQESETATEAFIYDEDEGEYSSPISKFRKGVASLPFKQRIQVFNALDNEMKAALWRDRLSEAMASRLSAEKKNAIEKAFSFITPELYATNSLQVSNEQLGNWKNTTYSAFKNDTLTLIKYITLLDDPVKGKTEKLSDTTISRVSDTTATQNLAGSPDCDCNIAVNSCFSRFPGTKCRGLSDSCDINIIGCGMFGLMTCNGRCGQ